MAFMALAAREIAGDHRLGTLSSAATMNPFPPRDGGPHLVDHHSRQPAWRQIHRSPFFWVAVVFILVAMTIYITTGNLSTGSGPLPAQPAPLAAP